MALVNLQREESSNHSVYWGKPTASVDWCELNYEKTEYIAEFYNTISSFAMVIAGLCGSLLHKWADYRFHLAFLATSAVGFGSIAFHATLLKSAQAFDEVPMLWSALTFLYIGINQRFKLSPSFQSKLAAAFILHAILVTLLVTLSNGGWQFALFHASFASAEFAALAQVISIYFKRGPKYKILFRRGIFMYLLGVLVWTVEIFYCDSLNPAYAGAILPFNPHFHAFWHVFVSIGLYNLGLLLLLESVEIEGGFIDVKYFFSIIPYGALKQKV